MVGSSLYDLKDNMAGLKRESEEFNKNKFRIKFYREIFFSKLDMRKTAHIKTLCKTITTFFLAKSLVHL